MRQEREIKKVRRHVCDFCNLPDPTMVWNTRDNQTLTMYAVDPKTGRAHETIKDNDGKWAACDACHNAIVAYKDAKLKDSALRRFISDLWKRGEWSEAFKNKPRVQKSIREQQKAMFEQVLPMFETVEPFVAWLKPGQEVTLTERTDEIIIPPGHIPDGSTRGLRL